MYEGELVGHDKLSGMPDLSGERVSDTVIGYFAYFKLLNGFEKTLYMTKEEAQLWRDRYSRAKSGNTPWAKEFDKMAMKTCLRRLISSYGIMSTQMQAAMQYDSESEQKRSAEKRVGMAAAAHANQTVIDIDNSTGEVIDAQAEVMPANESAQETEATFIPEF